MTVSELSIQMKVSVAMCTYDGVPHIREQLDSILKQTHTPSEIVVCDDGSSDGTFEILEEYRNDHDNLIELHSNRRNLGTTKNFEKCIRLCSGDLIALSDQDDVWEENKIQRQSEKMKGSGSGLSFHNTIVTEENLNELHDHWSAISYTAGMIDNIGLSIQRLLRRNFMSGHSMMFRSRMKDVLLPIPEEWMHDYYFAIKSLISGEAMDINDTLVKHRYHRGQTTGAKLPSISLLDRIRRGIETSFEENARQLNPQTWKTLHDEVNQTGRQKLAVDKSRLLDLIEDRWVYELNRNKIYDREVRVLDGITALLSNYNSKRYHRYEKAHPLLFLLKDSYSCITRVNK